MRGSQDGLQRPRVDGDVGFNTGTSNICNLNGGGEACVISGIDAIFGCDDETTEDLFQCERWDPSDVPELQYSFSVANGSYLVNLLFANTYTGTATGGSRVFDIQLEGTVVYGDFDQIAAAGGSGIAVVRSTVVNVTDGNGLQIEFLHVVENPAIKAIEVLALRRRRAPPTASATTATRATAWRRAARRSDARPARRSAATTATRATARRPAIRRPAARPARPRVQRRQRVQRSGDLQPALVCVAGTPLSCNDGNACNGAETCNAVPDAKTARHRRATTEMRATGWRAASGHGMPGRHSAQLQRRRSVHGRFVLGQHVRPQRVLPAHGRHRIDRLGAKRV